MRYIGLIDGDPGAFGLALPDCAGCTAMGATMDEALRHGTAALREWMADRVAAGLAPPPARTLDELRHDPEAAAALAEGAVAVALPLLLDKGRPTKANLSLDAGLLDAIDEAAAARGLTRSAFIASIAREKILDDAG